MNAVGLSGGHAIGAALVLVFAAALGAGLLIRALRPLLARYALARPNARSAHATPTPQGGGIAVVAAAIVGATAGAAALGLGGQDWLGLSLVFSATLLMAAVGFIDDIRPLPALPRLGLQLLAMALAVAAMPESARVLPMLPFAVERILLVVGGAWFVNLSNFMDGMDWMTVAEMVPATAALALFALWGFMSAPGGLIALALCGGLLGFAPFNAPVARLFLGDVGSLGIGLLVAFCLFDLASHGGLAAAILLPLYYIADSGVTLVWRMKRGDRVWEAHREHFYQVATARGLSVRQVLGRVLGVNLLLAALAAASLRSGGLVLWVTLMIGAVAVAILLRGLAAPSRRARS